MLESSFVTHITPTLRYMTEAQIKKIHRASLSVLENTGIEVYDSEALQILIDNGCYSDGKRVRIPEHVIRKALSSAPSRVTLFDRLRDKRLYLEGHKSHFGTGSCCPNFLDPITGERRAAVKQDVINVAKVCESVEEIDFVMSLALPRHEFPDMGYAHEFDAMVRFTSKPIVFSCQDKQNLIDIANIAWIASGGEQNFKYKPSAVLYVETTSPLKHSKLAIEKVLWCADHRFPVIYTIGMLAGATGPATIAGSLVQANAELLSGLAIHQLRKPGSPYIYGGTITAIDMKTMIHPYGNPEFQIFSILLTEMGNWYGLPVFSTGGCTDAKVFDEQASAEAFYSLLLQSLSGGNLIHDIGYTESGLTGSLHLIVFAGEVIRLLKHIVREIEVDEDSLALNVIDRVALKGGSFIEDEHTFRHFKNFFSPKLFDRRTFELWNKDATTLKDRIHSVVIEILEKPTELIIPEDVAQKIDIYLDDLEAIRKSNSNKS